MSNLSGNQASAFLEVSSLLQDLAENGVGEITVNQLDEIVNLVNQINDLFNK